MRTRIVDYLIVFLFVGGFLSAALVAQTNDPLMKKAGALLKGYKMAEPPRFEQTETPEQSWQRAEEERIAQAPRTATGMPMLTSMRVRTMPSFTTNQIYANAVVGQSISVWGNVKDGTPPYSYTLYYGDGTSSSGSVSNVRYISGAKAYATAGFKNMKLVVTDATNAKDSASSTIYVYPIASQQVSINMAIEKGLLFLYLNQNANGGWYDAYGYTAATGAALLAFEENGHLPGNANDIYAEPVRLGLNYLLANAVQVNIGMQPAGNPDTDGDGKGVYLYGGNSTVYGSYANGLGLLAFVGAHTSATSAKGDTIRTGPYNGQTYYAFLVDAIDQLAYSQTDSTSSGGINQRGGWRYRMDVADGGSSDNSTTQWPVLVMEAAENGWGLSIPPFVKSELLKWLQYTQNSSSGGFGYDSPTTYVNQAKTGAGISIAAFLGIPSSNSRMVNALTFLNNAWNANWEGYGSWAGQFYGGLYSMYSIAKGLRILNGRSGVKFVGTHDWYNEYVNHLLTHSTWKQQSDGRWNSAQTLSSGNSTGLNTAFALLTLTEGVVIQKPVARIDPLSSQPTNSAFQVSGANSYHLDPTKNIVEWAWDWDAGNGIDWNYPDATGMRPTNPGYPSTGTKTITLRVRDNSSPAMYATETATVLVQTSNNPPVAVPIPPDAGRVYAGRPGLPIQLDGRASYDPDAGDFIASYSWDTNGDAVFGDANSATTSVTFTSERQGEVGLKVTDSRSGVSTPMYARIINANRDLAVTHFTSAAVQNGSSYLLTLSAQCKNNDSSDVPVNNILVRFYDGNPLLTGTQLGNGIYLSLAVGELKLAQISVPVPPNIINKTLYVFLDANEQVNEWNERNNIKTNILPPMLSSPADSAACIAIQPALQWDPVSDNVVYQLQVARDAAFGTVVLNVDSLVQTSYQLSTVLDLSTVYFWRVRARNAFEPSAWTPSRRFTTVIGAPALNTPADGAGSVALSPTLQWSSVPGATYRVQVSLTATFTNILADIPGRTTTSAVLSGLQPNTTYYWRVSAANPSCNSGWSATRSFTTYITIPSLVYPENLASCIAARPIFMWTAVVGTASYDVQVAPDSSFAPSTYDLTGYPSTTYQPPVPLDTLKAYYWRVRARNSHGPGTWSQIRSFSTTSPAPIITALGPTTVCNGDSVTLEAQAGYSSYRWSTNETTRRIVVRTTGNFSVQGMHGSGCMSSMSQGTTVTIMADPYITAAPDTIVCPGTTVTLTAQHGTSYLWSTGPTTKSISVSPSSTTTYSCTIGNGTCSVSRSITVTVRPIVQPGAVSAMLPATGATNVNQPVAFSWQPGSNAVTYDLYIWPASQSARPGTPAASNLADLNYTHSGTLLYGTGYKWQVVSRSHCASYDGPVQTFTVRHLPDLRAQNVQAPASATAGQQMTVSWQVKNVGAGGTQAQTWTDNIYLSTDTIFNPSIDVLYASKPNLSALGVNQTYTNSAVLALPISLAGNYYALVVPNSDNSVLEVTTNNNKAFKTPPTNMIIPPLPNLRLATVGAPVSSFTGRTITVTYKVENIGNAPVLTPWQDAIYISPDSGIINANATLLATVPHADTLQNGYDYTRMTQVTIPRAMSGTRYIIVQTDRLNTVYESTEGDNVKTSSRIACTLEPPPDLEVTQCTVPWTGRSGSALQVQWTVTNTGLNAPYENSWIDRVWLCRTAVFNQDSVIASAYAYTTNGTTLLRDSSYSRTANLFIPNGIFGNFYVFVKTDADNGVYEYSDANNARRSSGFVSIILSPYADLVIDSLRVPTAAMAGRSMSVHWFVRNQGDTLARASWNDRIYLSTDATWNANTARLLHTATKNQDVQPGNDYAQDRTFMLPSNLVAGQYYVYARIDADNALYEYTAEDNNIRRSAAGVDISALPPDTTLRRGDPVIIPPDTIYIPPYNVPIADLRAASLNAATTANSGQALSLNWTVLNAGPGTTLATSWTDRIYLSTDSLLNSGDIYLGSVLRRGALDSGQTYPAAATVILPNGIAGAYHIFLNVDNNFDNENDSLRGNNRLGRPLTVSLTPPPDLRVDTLMMPPVASAGQNLAVRFRIRNAGSGMATGPWKEAVYIHTGPSWSPAAQLLGTYTRTGSLLPGGTYQDSLLVTLPSGSGVRYLIVRSDLDDNVYEHGMEDNNTGAAPITMQGPDLVVTQVTAPVQLLAGQRTMLRFTVRNNGTGNAWQPWSDGVFVSGRPFHDNTAVRIGTHNATLSLGPSAEHTDSVLVQLPPYLDGYYYLLVKTDVAGNVSETNESNNTNIAVTNITQPLPADLIVTLLSMPGTAPLGSTATLDYTIKNIGTNPAVGSVRDALYFSKDTTFDGATDRLFGVREQYLELAPNSTRSGSITTQVKDVDPGHYRGIARTNVTNSVVETTDANNMRATQDSIGLTVPQLQLDVPDTTTLNRGELKYYYVQVPADYDLLLDVNSNQPDQTGINEVYVAWNRVPTPADYDFKHRNPADVKQRVLIPETKAGRYYILMRTLSNYTPTGTNQNVYVLAKALPFSIIAVTPNRVGRGRVTTTILGAGFRDSTRFVLKQTGNDTVRSVGLIVESISSMEVRVRWWFDRDSIPLGLYDVAGSRGSQTARLSDGLYVEDPLPLEIAISGTIPDRVRVGSTAHFTIVFNNKSNVDIETMTASLAMRTDAIITGVSCTDNAALLNEILGRLSSQTNDSLLTGVHRYLGITYIPILCRDMSPSSTIAVNFTMLGFKQPELLGLKYSGTVYTHTGYLVKNLVDIENTRQALQIFHDTDKVYATINQLAKDKHAFRDSIIHAYVRSGVLSTEDTAGYQYISSYLDSLTVYLRENKIDIREYLTSNGWPVDNISGFLLNDNHDCSFCGQNNLPQSIDNLIIASSDIDWCLVFAAGNFGLSGLQCLGSLAAFVGSGALGVISTVASGGIVAPVAIAGVAAMATITGLSCASFANDAHETWQIVVEGKREDAKGFLDEWLDNAFDESSDFVKYGTVGIQYLCDILVDWKFHSYIPGISDLLPISIVSDLDDFGKEIPKLVEGGKVGINGIKDMAKGLVMGVVPSIVAGDMKEWCCKDGKSITRDVLVGLGTNPNFCGVTSTVIRAFDPNDIVGPSGYLTLRYTTCLIPYQYRIRFENNPQLASTAARGIYIVQAIHEDLRGTDLALGPFGFNNMTFEPPANSASYQQVLDLPDSLGYDVEVTAGLDAVNNEIFWNFQTIDPRTGLPPTNPMLGLLPVNDSTGRGEGFVTYTIKPKSTLVTGDSITAQASIVFDVNDPILTNTWRNTIDAGAPHSNTLAARRSVQDSVYICHFSGADDAGGSGIGQYALYVSEDNGPFVEYGSTRETSLEFTGRAGKSYRFFSRATDNVGNREAMKNAPDTLGIATGTIAGSPFCPGASISVPYVLGGSFGEGNMIIAQLSDSAGSFATPVDIGSIESRTSGSLTAVLPVNTTAATRYRIRVLATNPTTYGPDNGADLAVTTGAGALAAITPLGPTTFCPNDSVVLQANTGTGFTYQWRRDGSDITQATSDTYAARQSGAYTVVVTSGTCTSTSAPLAVLAQDNINPQITAPPDVNDSTDTGSCERLATRVQLGFPTVSDNCTGVWFSSDAPASFPKGTTIITWTAADAGLNTATATQRVTIYDTEKPTVTAPAPVSDTTEPGMCGRQLQNLALGIPTASDNCRGVTVTNNAPSFFPKGTTVVTWQAVDSANNLSTATQTVTVLDREHPRIVTGPDLGFPTDSGQCARAASHTAITPPAATDNCPVVTLTSNAPAVYPKGTTAITWTAVDSAGNVTTATQNITIEDREDPRILVCAQPDSAEANASDQAPVPDYVARTTAADNCSVASLTQLPAANSMVGAGITTIILTAADSASNTATCSASFTVVPRVRIRPATGVALAGFGCKTAGMTVNKAVPIFNDGGHFAGGVMQWTAATTAPEIVLLNTSGVEGEALRFQVRRDILPPGTHDRIITINARNSVTLAPASNGPYSLTVRISVDPTGPMTETRAIPAGTFVPFTNSIGQTFAEVRSNGGPISSFTITAYPCVLPQGITRLKYVNRYFTMSSSAVNPNVDVRFYYANSDLEPFWVYFPSDLRGWRQFPGGGIWHATTGNSEPTLNRVLVTNITDLNGNWAMAAPYDTLNLPYFPFTGTRQSPHFAQLTWRTDMSPQPYGFILDRRDHALGSWSAVGVIPASTTGEYEQYDMIIDNHVYSYRIAKVDEQGYEWRSRETPIDGMTDVDLTVIPDSYTLDQNAPNPVILSQHSHTVIRFSAPVEGHVSVSVFDTYGRRILSLADGNVPPGQYRLLLGASVLESGTYFYRLETAQGTITRRLVVLR